MSNLSYRRDAEFVLSNLKEVPKNKLVASVPCHIHLPKRFLERGLASIGDAVYIHGTFAIIIKDRYAVSNVTAMIEICPSRILDAVVDDVDYFDFHFDAGDVVINDLNVIKRDTLIFTLLEELIIKANIPWYFSYEDLGRLFDFAKEYADSSVGDLLAINEFIISLISRVSSDRTLYYRTSINSIEDMKQQPPAFIPLTNVFFAPTNTTNKLAGNYFDDGIISSLITRTNETENLESLLRA